MRVIIGYDGSDSSKAAIDDLQNAGLPPDSELHVVSVADLLMESPSPSDIADAAVISRRAAKFLEHAQIHATGVIREAYKNAAEGSDRIRTLLPDLVVTSEVIAGTPAWELIDAGNRFGADLLVVGSHGRSAVSRLFLGSVSNKIVTESGRAVRVSRSSGEQANPTRIIIGVDGSPAAEQAIFAVSQRVWADGTEVKLVAVDDGTKASGGVSTLLPQAAEIISGYNRERESRVRSMLNWGSTELARIGLETSVLTRKGEASKVLLEEARKWQAGSIFMGTRDFGSEFERFRLGSVSRTIVNKANCSVEIVRPFK